MIGRTVYHFLGQSRAIRILAVGASVLYGGSGILAQDFGIASRASNTTLLIDSLPPVGPGTLITVPAFNDLGFEDPIDMAEPPDGSGRLFVLERRGIVLAFPNDPDLDPLADVSIVMDIRDRVTSSFGEIGALGLAFDPDYATNGRIYVHYNDQQAIAEEPFTRIVSFISRFTNAAPAGNSIDPATEDVILTVNQINEYHNGGALKFGPDGMLYASFGDGNDDSFTGIAQDTTNLLGTIVRLDVTTPPADPGAVNYVIPADNPFVGGMGPVPGAREEIFAYGLRNPWRISFDQQTGTLFCGDVGENRLEEIDVIVSGGNYGFPIMEGTECFNRDDPNIPLGSCDVTGLELPIAEHDHNDSISVIGGATYYGSDVPDLFGLHIYTDFVTGMIWGLRYVDGEVSQRQVLIADSGLTVFGTGQDSAGEVYLIANGHLRVLRLANPGGGSNFPIHLSDMPALLAAGSGLDQTAAGIIPFAPEARLWSDGALKERFIALPGLSQITFSESGAWQFPAATVLIKNFNLPLDFRDPAGSAVRIETRLLVRNGGEWHGFSYEWNEAQTDAVLLNGSRERPFTLTDEQGQSFEYNWFYPGRGDCLRCHTEVGGAPLGPNTAQMNHAYTFPASGVADNQLRAYDHVGLFTEALPVPPGELPASPAAFDPTAGSIEERALSYINANCAMCHQPGGPTRSSMDLRWATPLAGKAIIDIAPELDDAGIANARLVAPGDPNRSVIVARMEALGQLRMPPLGSSLVDGQGVQLIRDWIDSLGLSSAGASWAIYE